MARYRWSECKWVSDKHAPAPRKWAFYAIVYHTQFSFNPAWLQWLYFPPSNVPLMCPWHDWIQKTFEDSLLQVYLCKSLCWNEMFIHNAQCAVAAELQQELLIIIYVSIIVFTNHTFPYHSIILRVCIEVFKKQWCRRRWCRGWKRTPKVLICRKSGKNLWKCRQNP